VKYGYARVLSSATIQDLNVRLQQLKDFGCEKIYQENSTKGADTWREFQKLLEIANAVVRPLAERGLFLVVLGIASPRPHSFLLANSITTFTLSSRRLRM